MRGAAWNIETSLVAAAVQQAAACIPLCSCLIIYGHLCVVKVAKPSILQQGNDLLGAIPQWECWTDVGVSAWADPKASCWDGALNTVNSYETSAMVCCVKTGEFGIAAAPEPVPNR